MKINLHQVPFSRFGACMALHYVPTFWNLPGLLLRNVRSTGGIRESFHVQLERDGVLLPATATADPARLYLVADDGSAKASFTFATANRILFEVKGADLAFLSLADQRQICFHASPDRFLVNAPISSARYQFCRINGSLKTRFHHEVRTQDKRKPENKFSGSWAEIRFTSGSSGTVDDYDTVAPSAPAMHHTFAQAYKASAAAWKEWLEKVPFLASKWKNAAALATYVNYSAGVLPGGSTVIRRPTLLMSKNWMTRCWSWDHCFNALALAPRQPDLAWDQWMTLFDHQNPEGALPDCIGVNIAEWGFVKPPIHGWTLARMAELNPAILTPERCKQAYSALKRWTQWWLETRDLDGDGLPEYQHGNDSGWDNSTIFDEGLPVVSPDLIGYLVVQCETLAMLARRLGESINANCHENDARALLHRLTKQLWDGAQFRARRAGGSFVMGGDSLQPFLTLLVGKRLPAHIREKLARDVERFLTCAGPATECPRSPDYVADGYWRGPVWGSSTVLLVEGLMRSGYPEIARRMARAYCENAAQQMCFAENYSADDGAPLRDKAYTWGSSAYLHLASAVLCDDPHGAKSSEHSQADNTMLATTA